MGERAIDPLKTLPRRGFLLTAGGLAAAACAPTAAPVQKATSGGAKQDWEQEWDDVVAGARREGKLVLQTRIGDKFRSALGEFEAAFPGIEVENTTLALQAFRPRIMQERSAGIYTF